MVSRSEKWEGSLFDRREWTINKRDLLCEITLKKINFTLCEDALKWPKIMKEFAF